MRFTLYRSNCLEVPENCTYPHKVEVTGKDSLIEAVKHDYVCAEYQGNYRSNDNFIGSDCLPVDCDNDHSDDPEEWVYPSDVATAFPGVAFAVHYSRNHMKAKGGKAARPKFHVFFAINRVTEPGQYSEMKKLVNTIFPYFDTKALDAARFFFGTKEPEVDIFDGPMTLTTFLADDDFDATMDSGSYGDIVIPEGSRNATLSHYAGRILKRFGNTDEAHKHFAEVAACCQPPLEQSELDSIWRSAQRFYGKVAAQEGYIPPEQYNQDLQLKPSDYSDVGQATVLAKEYEGKLRYSPSTDFLVYNGRFWEESKPKSQAVAQELTTRQLEEAETEIKKATDEMMKNGAWELLASMGPKKAAVAFSSEQARSFQKYENATAYRNYAIKRRDSKYITAALKEAHPMVEIDQRQLDADEFLLNTPSATYDLRIGLPSAHEHTPADFITKQTTVDPSDDGMDIWQDALETFFCADNELIDYVQEIAGLSAIGKVCVEGLIIAYGEGRNGKSTFWNTLSRVLGTYSGNMSADTLTVGCKRNVKPELAEAKGKRIIIAAELEEGMRLNTSNVKQLCSTDEIYAEKKYKDPFSFVPSHTLVLYTNHLPKVGAIDAGTWRRLIVIPFNAKIEGSSDIKNYADYLFNKAGGAILKWIMTGAKRVIEKDYHIVKPAVVEAAIQKYKDNNDWLSQFLDECCEIDSSYSAKSGDVYNAYRSYCMQVGDYIRSTTDFYTALECAGFERKRSKSARLLFGLQLKSDFLD
ncbi:MAG: primase C-terminal domain-containing protein [[Eubacterium] siraeum]|nr:primase C-terminal domain-containing protein [[Eubacterium] siraeum]DAI93069.1 MAG TPA: dsDNA helicase [Caudoviricetes sp.]